MSSLLRRAGRRYLEQHPWLLALSVVGVILGVSLVVAVDLASSSARRAFQQSVDAVTGKATHQIWAPTGVADTLYRWLRCEIGLQQAAPIVERYAQVGDRVLQLLGLDPLAEAPFRPYIRPGSGLDLAAFLTQPNAAVMAHATAEALALGVGDTFTVEIDGQRRMLRLMGVLEATDARTAEAIASLLLVDVSTAQEQFGMLGRLSRIDVILSPAEATRLRPLLPSGTELIPIRARTETAAQMTRAFTLNLQAMSLLALIVAMFMIYNTMMFAVMQRRIFFGRLRALGVTRGEIIREVLLEATWIGGIGTLLGLLVGYLLAQGLVRLVTQTINDLYYVVVVRHVALESWTLAKGIVLGIGTTLLAALAPAYEAAAVPPRLALLTTQEAAARSSALRPMMLGLLLGLGSAGVLLISEQSLVLGYLGLLIFIGAVALQAPVALVVLAKGARWALGHLLGVTGRMAARALVAYRQRTAVAVAALSVALSATIGVEVMIKSFRETLEVWLNNALQADVYVQPPSPVARRPDATIDPEVVRRIQQLPGVSAVYAIRRMVVATEYGEAELGAFDVSPVTPRTFRFKEGNPQTIWAQFDQAPYLIVSEPFSYRFGVHAGDTLQLLTLRGWQPFFVLGVFYDYGSDVGVMLMDRSVYRQYFADSAVTGLALYAKPGISIDTLITQLAQTTADRQALLIRSNRALRAASMEVFDRTFQITAVLRWLTILVALVGILAALMAMALERGKELGVLRALGLTPRELGRYVVLFTVLLGLTAGLLALPLGIGLAAGLIYVINWRSFGWTLQFLLPPEVLVQALLLALGAALVAGLYPAWKMAHLQPAEALRNA